MRERGEQLRAREGASPLERREQEKRRELGRAIYEKAKQLKSATLEAAGINEAQVPVRHNVVLISHGDGPKVTVVLDHENAGWLPVDVRRIGDNDTVEFWEKRHFAEDGRPFVECDSSQGAPFILSELSLETLSHMDDCLAYMAQTDHEVGITMLAYVKQPATESAA